MGHLKLRRTLVTATCLLATVIAGCKPQTGALVTSPVVHVERPSAPSTATKSPTILVWTKTEGSGDSPDPKNAKNDTFSLRHGTSERVSGIEIATRTGTWRWITDEVTVATEPCDDESPPQEGSSTRAALARSPKVKQVIFDPPTTTEATVLSGSVDLVGSLGPLLFIEQGESTYNCGAAHGGHSASFLVWDAERAEAVDVLKDLPDEQEIFARAVEAFAAAEEPEKVDDQSFEITELRPVFHDGELSFEAQVTIDACYACSDGNWSSYTKSVRVPAEIPEVAVPYAHVPPEVARFAKEHPELTIGGFSILNAK